MIAVAYTQIATIATDDRAYLWRRDWSGSLLVLDERRLSGPEPGWAAVAVLALRQAGPESGTAGVAEALR